MLRSEQSQTSKVSATCHLFHPQQTQKLFSDAEELQDDRQSVSGEKTEQKFPT